MCLTDCPHTENKPHADEKEVKFAKRAVPYIFQSLSRDVREKNVKNK
jgi:hypothetical protein